jgi:signal transduction histidine kinase
MRREELVELLAAHRTIGSAPRQELLWIAEHGSLRHFEQGEQVTTHTEEVDALHILLTGCVSIYVNRGTGLRKVMEWRGGDVTGLLPYSRLKTPPGDTYVEEPTDSVVLYRNDLPALIRNCYEVTSILVHVMTDRARQFTSTDLRNEKMISLGKLAAGFAHEINNPASAALRDAKSLESVLSSTREAARVLLASGLSKEQLAHLNTFLDRSSTPPEGKPLSGLQLADREDAVAEWLNTHGITEMLASDIAATPATSGDLDALARSFSGAALENALRWVTGTFSAQMLIVNIERAATRIHGLVTAAKGFTHMDRAPDLEPVMIYEGLRDTVALLEGKARGKSIDLALEAMEDVPPVRGYAGEINQVWMNLIDNAIDAAPERGHVTVRGTLEGADVIVSVIDDGQGIPPDIVGSIFDPFFTTKSVGEGTGLGLDIARRVVHAHNGEISVNSRPGRTEFIVRLPVAGPG